MGRVLRFAAPGVAGVGLSLVAVAAYWLWCDYSRTRTPPDLRYVVPVGRWVPVYDGGWSK